LPAPLARSAGLRLLAAALLLSAGLVGALAAQASWELPGLRGGSLSSSEVASGTTVMVVFAGWSPHCSDIVERSNALAGRLDGRARVVLVDFQEDPAEVSAFLEGKGARSAVYLDSDGTFSKQHRVMTLPGMVAYRDGAVVYQGKLPQDPESVLGDGRR
jgi:hypothetical protein